MVAEQHSALMQTLLDGRADNSLTEAADDALCEQLDELWWKMSDEEQAAAEMQLPMMRATARARAVR